MAYSQPVDVRNALAPGVWAAPDDGPPPRTGTAADLSDAQLADAIAEADGLIDAYLGGRYATPVDPVGGQAPAPVRWWSRDIAAYNATLTNRKGKDLSPTDPVALRYAQTMSALTATRDGKSSLSLPQNAGPGGTSGAATPLNPYSGQLFGPTDFDLYPANQPYGPSPFWRTP